MILDTGYLVALGTGDPDAFAKGEALADAGEIQWLPVPVIQELEYGVAFTGSTEAKRRARNACRLYPPVQVDREIARRAGQLLARADRDHGGEIGAAGIDSVDPVIAAVGDLFDDAILTDNVEDFEKLGVEVETFRR